MVGGSGNLASWHAAFVCVFGVGSTTHTPMSRSFQHLSFWRMTHQASTRRNSRHVVFHQGEPLLSSAAPKVCSFLTHNTKQIIILLMEILGLHLTTVPKNNPHPQMSEEEPLHDSWSQRQAEKLWEILDQRPRMCWTIPLVEWKRAAGGKMVRYSPEL